MEKTVNVKELNEKRIQRLAMRSEFPILATFFLNTAMNWEQEDRKILTTLYRENFGSVLTQLNGQLRKGLYSTLATNYEMPAEKEFRMELDRYLALMTMRRCPLEF